jgi:5-hydroxyisourate hydrolase
MGRLTTHVLDTAQGQPAAGVRITLHRHSGEERFVIASFLTNADGRVDEPLVEDDAFVAGTYELTFAMGDYFAAQDLDTPDPPFFDEAIVRFTVSDPGKHYHIPLLATPWSWTTYRGS